MEELSINKVEGGYILTLIGKEGQEMKLLAGQHGLIKEIKERLPKLEVQDLPTAISNKYDDRTNKSIPERESTEDTQS